MNTCLRCLLALAVFLPGPVAVAQEAFPTASPTMTVTEADGTEEETTTYEGSAPLRAVFRANPENVGAYVPYYEWRFTREGEAEPFLTRFDEDTEYNFTTSGTTTVELYISFVQGTDTIEFVTDAPFVVTISESKLEMPNAFTPNGDGINDVLRAKDGYESIVSFHAVVFNRWGRKLYEWDDPAGEELAQVAVVEAYLPQPLTPEELEAAVRDIIAETGATGMKDMGRVMGTASKRLAGRADGKALSEAVKRLLA